jgi:BirA family biotin operon repressor/biotin-[acetyl-CoA-carboxylase] ligase
VHEAVSRYLPTTHAAMLKWPNDVLVSGAKMAGILLERRGDAVVVGIGVNLAQAPDLPDRATFALADLGIALDPDQFANDLAECFTHQIRLWRSYGLAPLIARWQAAAHPLGTSLNVSDPAGPIIHGRFAGLDEQGPCA